MIIGLVGKNGAGKGEVARFLQEIGFEYYSLSDAIRMELKKRGREVTRKNLTELANELRAGEGAGVLGQRIATILELHQNYVVDSIRHPAEVEAFRHLEHFFLLSVDADPKIRFERLKTRAREQDPITYEDFLVQEAKEAKGEKTSDQQINKTIELANAYLENNGTLEEVRGKVRSIVQSLAMEAKRPDWDTYFMQIAKQVSLRSNCIKRKVAAVIVKDQRIISTGYNGTPRGIKNCNEGGCPRCNSFGSSGANLDTCLCSHAEENAIVQSAYHGVNVSGATLYTTLSPCLLCTKMIINSGIKEVIYNKSYSLEATAHKLLKEAGVQTKVWTKNHD